MNLFPRVLSAFVALCLLGGITFYGNATGLALAASLIILGAFNEFRKITFEKIPTPKIFQALFIITGIFIFTSILYGKSFSSIGFAVGFSFFYIFGLWVTRNKVTNENLLRIYGLGATYQILPAQMSVGPAGGA
ncbi:MAG: hypothetical protein KDD34_05110, partial [Bdellovibrionales bacterium]|nr:hypothetical protein [Bdellovibrionales bacterium]